MKRTLLIGAWAVLSVGAAQAAPITYSFSGMSVGEFNGAGAPVSSNTLFSGTTAVSGMFTYDSDLAAVGFVPVPGYNNALFTAYQGAFSNIDINLAGASVTADSGAGLVGDNAVLTGTNIVLDVTLGLSSGADPLANLSPLNIGDWSLTSFAFVFFNWPTTYTGTALPAGPAGIDYLMEFFFEDSQGLAQKVRYRLAGLQVQETPVAVDEPSSLLMLALGIAGLLGRKRGFKLRAKSG